MATLAKALRHISVLLTFGVKCPQYRDGCHVR